ncbi:MAG: formate dehydrogenase accessory sulfurtransferase FdhD [Candidatus Woesearchaeota archaeon]
MKKEYNIIKIINNKKKKLKDIVVKEFPLKLFINGQEASTLLCSPDKLNYLIIGYLFSENIIKAINEIKSIKINEPDGIAIVELKKEVDTKNKIIYSGCASFYDYKNLKIKKIKNNVKTKKEKIMKLMIKFQLKSKLFQETGGVHASALAAKDKIVFFTEDIGRHNTVDKIVGYALTKKLNLRDKIILTTGRLSSEMVLKSVKAGIPIVVSKSAPTDMAVNLAKKLNVTLIGFARGQRFNIYNNGKNIV